MTDGRSLNAREGCCDLRPLADEARRLDRERRRLRKLGEDGRRRSRCERDENDRQPGSEVLKSQDTSSS